MNNFGTKSIESPTTLMKSEKHTIFAQILLRILATAFTLTAACIMFNSKQTLIIFTVETDARYTYSPALKFFAYANMIGCGFSILSLFIASIFGRKSLYPHKYFYLFIHDMIIMALLLSGFSAATTIGYIGKYGQIQSGWMPICDSVTKFCHKIIASLIFSAFGVFFYLCLAILSANQSRKIQI